MSKHKLTIVIENRPRVIGGKSYDRWFATDNKNSFHQTFELAKEYYEDLYSSVSDLRVIKIEDLPKLEGTDIRMLP